MTFQCPICKKELHVFGFKSAEFTVPLHSKHDGTACDVSGQQYNYQKEAVMQRPNIDLISLLAISSHWSKGRK